MKLLPGFGVKKGEPVHGFCIQLPVFSRCRYIISIYQRQFQHSKAIGVLRCFLVRLNFKARELESDLACFILEKDSQSWSIFVYSANY